MRCLAGVFLEEQFRVVYAWMMDSIDGNGNNDKLVTILSTGNDRLLATSHAQVNRLNPA